MHISKKISNPRLRFNYQLTLASQRCLPTWQRISSPSRLSIFAHPLVQVGGLMSCLAPESESGRSKVPIAWDNCHTMLSSLSSLLTLSAIQLRLAPSLFQSARFHGCFGPGAVEFRFHGVAALVKLGCVEAFHCLTTFITWLWCNLHHCTGAVGHWGLPKLWISHGASSGSHNIVALKQKYYFEFMCLERFRTWHAK